MWKITYVIEMHTRDQDNNPTVIMEGIECACGDTLDDAESELFYQLQGHEILRRMVNKHSYPVYADFWRDIRITSVDKVSESTSMDFHKLPRFLSLVERKKREITSQQNKNKLAQEEAKVSRELKLLEELETKYRRKT